MTNAVRHAGGRGTVRVLRDGELLCEVIDDGPGVNWKRYIGRPAPPDPGPTAGGGRGLWLIEQTTTKLSISSGPDGTTVRIAVPLEGR